LAFPRASFDLVLISNALHHLAEPEESIQEMMRVLKPGGLFMLREMYRDLQQGARRVHVDVHHWWACVDQLRGIPHFQTYTRRELIEITEKLGLSDVVIMDIDENDSLSNDPGTIQAIEQKINESIEWLRENSDTRDLIQQGENLKERLHGEGFFSATKLLAAGIKPEDTNPAAEDPGPGC
ncbi:MAG: class I SAM-dependent methyltransferase, partial [Anaerolineales bacterium]|nr:class I SAM-dependent methyltransferase [Anaerolineales bacterium]